MLAILAIRELFRYPLDVHFRTFLLRLSEVGGLVVGGAGVGWILGQSTGLTQSAVGGLIAIATAVLATLAGIQAPPTSEPVTRPKLLGRVTPVPLALFLVGLCITSAVSLRARTHELIGLSVSDEVARWETLGIPKDEVRLDPRSVARGFMTGLAVDSGASGHA